MHHHELLTVAPAEVRHPLDLTTAEELERGREILVEAGLVGEHTRFPNAMPVEPAKAVLAAFADGDPVVRRLRYTLLEIDSGAASEVVVNLTAGEVEVRTVLDSRNAPYGQPSYLYEEYEAAEAIVKASPEWRAAMERRGLGDRIDLAFCGPLAPGFFNRADEVGRRVIRSLTFVKNAPDDNHWSHPVEGLIVHIDLTERRVIRVEDVGDAPLPDLDGRYDAESVGPARTSLKPIEITQPEGPSFAVDGNLVEWENWRFRIGFNAREGLVLNQLSFRDGDEHRSVIHRASVPEMVVPYGDTTPTRFWISYFDAGEYLLGKNANALQLGCDCLGVIRYFDAHVAGDDGHAVHMPNVVCMHEEDYGILWKHSEFGERPEVRRSRRLVISYFATVGNYDYGFFWYLYLDGSIQMEAKATGIVFAGAGLPGEDDPHANEIAPGLYAPVHQHLFCARLDMAVDGEDNTLAEVDVVGVPTGPSNPHGNAFTWQVTPITRESEAGRMANGPANRVWEVASASRRNAVGRPTAFHLMPEGKSTLLAQPDSTVWARANFATKHLWATAYAPDELYPAGPYPNAHEGWAGLPTWQRADRDLDGTDLVLWHVFGPTHVPRTEDWPIMPVDYSGFWMKPYGFLDRNPALDLPDASRAGAHAPEAAGDLLSGGSSGGCGGGDACACGH